MPFGMKKLYNTDKKMILNKSDESYLSSTREKAMKFGTIELPVMKKKPSFMFKTK